MVHEIPFKMLQKLLQYLQPEIRRFEVVLVKNMTKCNRFAAAETVSQYS